MTSRKDTGDSGVAQTQTLRQFDMLDAAPNRCHELTQRPITNGQAFKPELGQDSVNVRSHCIIPALADGPERPYECGGAVGVGEASPEQGNRNVIHSGTFLSSLEYHWGQWVGTVTVERTQNRIMDEGLDFSDAEEDYDAYPVDEPLPLSGTTAHPSDRTARASR